jgi:hypothetical protein
VEGHDVLQQIALLMTITPFGDAAIGLLEVKDVDEGRSRHLSRCSFILSLTLESGEANSTYAQGHVRTLADDEVYPIRCSRSLFDALSTYLDHPEDPE